MCHLCQLSNINLYEIVNFDVLEICYSICLTVSSFLKLWMYVPACVISSFCTRKSRRWQTKIQYLGIILWAPPRAYTYGRWGNPARIQHNPMLGHRCTGFREFGTYRWGTLPKSDAPRACDSRWVIGNGNGREKGWCNCNSWIHTGCRHLAGLLTHLILQLWCDLI